MRVFLLTVFIAKGETGSIGEPEVLHVIKDDQSFEVIWLKIMPKKLPRAFLCIILACIYHPSGANSAAMRDHVINGVDSMVQIAVFY